MIKMLPTYFHFCFRRHYILIMKVEKQYDKIFVNKINAKLTNRRACNMLFFRIKYQCFQALLTNYYLYGISTEMKSRADGEFDYGYDDYDDYG